MVWIIDGIIVAPADSVCPLVDSSDAAELAALFQALMLEGAE